MEAAVPSAYSIVADQERSHLENRTWLGTFAYSDDVHFRLENMLRRFGHPTPESVHAWKQLARSPCKMSLERSTIGFAAKEC